MPDNSSNEPKFADASALNFKIWEMQKDTYVFDFGGAVSMYLLVGADKALVIDTAYGYGDIPGLIRKFTDKPLIVVNTHAHGDHTGGNAFFPDVHLFRPPFFMHAMPGARPASDFPHPRYRKIAVEDGHVFDLGGGREVEVITIPAHNDSSVALLDRRQRLLFTGDELEAGQVLMFEDAKTQITAHLANMKKLWARRDEFDYLCPSHNGVPVVPDLIMDFIRLDESILTGQPKLVDDPFFPRMLVQMKGDQLQGLRAEYGRASIVYAVPKAYEPKFAGHPQESFIRQALAHGGLMLDAGGAFYPDKPATAAELAGLINHLAPLFNGSSVEVPFGPAAANTVIRKDAYVMIAMALRLEGVMGWPSFMPGGAGAQAPDLRQNAAAAMQRYNASLFGQNTDAWLTRGDAAQIAATLAYKARMLSLFEPGRYESGGHTMHYRFFSPLQLEPGRKYPLILFLHGGGESGTDNKFQLTCYDGASVWADKQLHGGEPPCFVLAPQAFPSPKMGWNDEQCQMVMDLIDKLAAEYPIDTASICCTGLSMGGRGTWTINRLFPDRFACMVGICGTYAFDMAVLEAESEGVIARLKNKPIWVFHAEDDVVVDVNLSRRLVGLFRQAGSDIMYTEYPASAGFNHGSWVPAYADKAMRDWVFAQFKH